MDSDSSDSDSASGPLTTAGVDLSNSTQAADFLDDLLDDTVLQVTGNKYARFFWYGIVVLIAIFALINIIKRLRSHSRLKHGNKNGGRELSGLWKPVSAVSALTTWITYPQFTPSGTGSYFKIPPVGVVILLLLYLAFILALEYIGDDVPGAQHWQALGIRGSWLGIAQVPLLLLLAGKNNLIGAVTGISYERLNVFHRWVSRGLLLLITFHVAYQNYGWDKYGLRTLEWSTDTCVPTGWGAYALLLWLNLSTFAPLRHLSYEFFVIQHLITFWGFIIAVMFHLPTTAVYSRVYIYIGIGIWLFDRLVRTARLAYHNIRPSRAVIAPLTGGATRVQVHNKAIKNWIPGSHVLLSIPKYGIGQSHPATIASTPSSHNGDLVFILKGRRGFTKRILRKASVASSEKSLTGNNQEQHFCVVDGPYGGTHPDFASYDTVVLIAGSTGVTFTLPILLDIAHRASSQKLPVGRLEFIWAVRSQSCLSWVEQDLRSAFDELQAAGIKVAITIFVTCGRFCDQASNPASVGEEVQSISSSNTSDRSGSRDIEAGDKGIEADEKDIEADHREGFAVRNQAQDTVGPLPSSSSFVTFKSERPIVYSILKPLVLETAGSTGVAACGPLGMNTSVRLAVARVSKETAGKRELGSHIEGFAW